MPASILYLTRLLTSLLIITLATTVNAQSFKEGVEYVLVSPIVTNDQGTDGKVSVKEFFWYGCPHCYTLEPSIHNWKKPATVEFATVPTILGKQWTAHAYTYYTLEALGRLEELHPVLFDAIHSKKKRLSTLKQLADFFTDYGINEETFRNTFNSFAVNTKVNASQNLVKKYKLRSVPTITVNGKYMTSPSMAGYDRLIDVIEYLVNLETDKQPLQPAASDNAS